MRGTTTILTQGAININPSIWTNTEVTVSIANGVDLQSGVQKSQYRVGEAGEWMDYATPLIISEEGINTIYARTIDNVGNISTEATGVVRIDRTPPSVPYDLQYTHEIQYNRAMISWAESVDNVSVALYEVYNRSELIGTSTTNQIIIANLTSGILNHVTIRAKDVAGNYSALSDPLEFSLGTVISAGLQHTLSLQSDGTVWSWGNNMYGQLGDGTTTNQYVHVPVANLTDVRSVSAGNGFSLAVKNDGTVWSWGRNEYGQLGHPAHVVSSIPIIEVLIPEQIVGPNSIIEVSAGNTHSLALQSDGTVWQWGVDYDLWHYYPYFGDGGKLPWIDSVIAISAGYSHSVALKSDGTVWTWGENVASQLGNGSWHHDTRIPIQVPELTSVKAISANYRYTLALKHDGTVWGWGQIPGYGIHSFPTQINQLSSIAAISAGNYFALVLRQDGTVWSWGYNQYGQLGNGSNEDSHTPVQVIGMHSARTISAGSSHSLTLKNDGTLWAWGVHGAVGDSTNANRSTPVLTGPGNHPTAYLTFPTGTRFSPTKVSITKPEIVWNQVDVEHTVFSHYQFQVWDETGESVVFDSGEVPQYTDYNVGRGSVTEELPVNQLLQVRVRVRDGSLWSNWSQYGWIIVDSSVPSEPMISSGGAFTLYLQSDGTIRSWGDNTYGQLGDGTERGYSSAPVLVTGIDEVSSISAGWFHSLALKKDGTVWSWGRNDYRQLGPFTTNMQRTPVQVDFLDSIIAVSAGNNHSLALKDDGTVWEWGHKSRPQDSSFIGYPRQVPGLDSVVAIAAGQKDSLAYANLALKSDGTVWVWGNNMSDHYLGNGMNEPWTPLQLPLLTSVQAIANGNHLNVFLNHDGTVWTTGQCGINDCYNYVPHQVSGLSMVNSISAKGLTAAVVKQDGTVWSWGNNSDGQLGNGSSTNGWISWITPPSQIIGLQQISGVSIGGFHGAALKSDGTVWSWGNNERGSLGNGTTTNHYTPVTLVSVEKPIASITYPSGTQSEPTVVPINKPEIQWDQLDKEMTVFTLFQVEVRDETGAVLILDSEEVTQNSLEPTGSWISDLPFPNNQLLKVRVRVRNGLLWSDWTDFRWIYIQSDMPSGPAISTGGSHTLSLQNDGTVWTWGSNTYGQLGGGTPGNQNSPIEVYGLADVSMITAGGDHSLALTQDGAVWSWGRNHRGQLGILNGIDQAIPVQVYRLTGMDSVIYVSAGNDHNLALASDGRVWAWGGNSFGQLGFGYTSTFRRAPELVPELESIIEISSGDNHSVALKSDGTVWAWGNNNSGQLGNGSTFNRVSPFQVPGLTSVVAIYAGGNHTIAVGVCQYSCRDYLKIT